MRIVLSKKISEKSRNLCITNLEFLEILLSKFCQDFPPHPIPLPRLRGRGEGEGVISLVLFGCGYAALCNQGNV